MAQILTASVYGQGSDNDLNQAQGVLMGFPAAGIVLTRLNEAKTFSGVSCVTQITLLPTAPSPIQRVYFCPTAIGSLISTANT